MFKRFMKNKAKKAAAKEQGIFTITEQPIKIKIDMPPTYPKKKKLEAEDYRSLLGNVDLGDFEDKEPVKRRMLDFQDPNYEYTGKSKPYIKESLEDPRRKQIKILHSKMLKLIDKLNMAKDSDESYDIIVEMRAIEEDIEDLQEGRVPKKRSPKLNKLPFKGEELEESMPSQAPTKKNIDIKKIKYDEEILKYVIRRWYGDKYGANPNVSGMDLKEIQKFIEKENIPIRELHTYYNDEILRLIDDYEGMIRVQNRLIEQNPNIDPAPMMDNIKNLEKSIGELFQKMKDYDTLNLPDRYFSPKKQDSGPQRVKRVRNTPFEKLMESMPSQKPTKKNINIYKKPTQAEIEWLSNILKKI
jgi:hypothetical protein